MLMNTQGVPDNWNIPTESEPTPSNSRRSSMNIIHSKKNVVITKTK